MLFAVNLFCELITSGFYTLVHGSCARRASSMASIEALLANCPRAGLEALIASKVRSGEATTREELVQLVKAKESVVQVAAATDHFTGTGLFDWLDLDVLHALMMQLDLPTRLTLTIAVCKAWRVLRGNTQLWQSLDLATETCHTAMRRHVMDNVLHPTGRIFDKPLKVSDSGLQRLLAWLPDPKAVTHLALHAGMFTDSMLSVPAQKAALTALSGLQELDLGGKKCSAAVWAHATKQPWVASLRRLHVDASCGGSDGNHLSLINNTSVLEELDAHCARGSLGQLAASWRRSRDGGVPLLSSLTSGLAGKELATMGEILPELRKLHLQITSELTHLGVSRVAPMPQLRVLHMGRIIPESLTAVSRLEELKTNLDASMALLLAATPALEELKIAHGAGCGYGRDRTRWSTQQRAGASVWIRHLPLSLRYLELHGFPLDVSEDAEASDDIMTLARLPALRTLRLHNCGPAVTAEAWQRLRAPLDKVQITVDSEEKDTFHLG